MKNKEKKNHSSWSGTLGQQKGVGNESTAKLEFVICINNNNNNYYYSALITLLVFEMTYVI